MVPREPDYEESNSWREYRRLVTQGIKDLDADMKRLEEKVEKMQLQFSIDINTLKMKAGAWGALAGVISALIVSVIAGIIVEKLK